jgi:hypothetical protein
MALDAAQVKARIGDELGLTDEDLARLYGVDLKALDKHLASLGKDVDAVCQRILSDVDGVRVGYRVLQVSDKHIAAVRELLRDYIFHPLVSVEMANTQTGWRLSSDDAQFVAFRAADIVVMDHDWSEVLRLRLKRLIVWPAESKPETNKAFRDRVADITFYLVELTGVL